MSTTCNKYTRRTFLMGVHSLTFDQTSCRYMSSSRWSRLNLDRFLVIILPAAENMRSGTTKVAGTTKTFLPKRAIHGTTEEAHLNSVRGFLCDGNACRRILHQAASTSLGGKPGRLGTLSIETSIHDLDLWRVSQREREEETTQRRQRECGIRVCVLSERRNRQDRTREERKGLRPHESARQGVRANKKSTHVGSIDLPWCRHEVGEKGLCNPPRTRLKHPQTLSRIPRSLKSTLEFPSPHPLETRQDEIRTDLFEVSDDADWYTLVGASCSRSCPSRTLIWKKACAAA